MPDAVSTEQSETVIAYDPQLCTGCRYCEVVCAVWHYQRIEVNRSRIRILFRDAEAAERFAAVHCQHCDDPICAAVCPSEALRKDAETGWVMPNASKCVGCELCVVACPLAVPFFDAERKVAAKCDFCLGDPQCVRHCSSGALRVVPRAEAVRLNRRLYLGEAG
jgi:Fe-S-cluster-containing dehydrogenase component